MFGPIDPGHLAAWIDGRMSKAGVTARGVGAAIVELIFGLPGVGYVLLQAIFNRDYPLVQGATLIIAVIFVLANLAVDIVYGWLDPRIVQE